MKKTDVYIWCFGTILCAFTFQSCSEDEITIQETEKINAYSKVELNRQGFNHFSKPKIIDHSINEIFLDDNILGSTCPKTEFGEVLFIAFEALLNDPYFDIDLINYYAELNRKYVTHYRGENYYGKNGEYNHLAKKRIRELENFRKLNRDIYLNAQHTSSLNDREILADMIESFDRTVRNRDEAYQKADLLLEINSLSPNIPENPYFALSAFTKSNGLLVIGDGLLESLVNIGIEGEIAFTSILAHEWWHQAQFENIEVWNFKEGLESPAEKSRFSELEADFAAAYYLTHKRGATYNWKRIEDYFSLSYNVGDCLVNSDDHHGTPAQRLTAAKMGYDHAAAAQKKGHVLTALEVHKAFIEIYETMIQESI